MHLRTSVPAPCSSILPPQIAGAPRTGGNRGALDRAATRVHLLRLHARSTYPKTTQHILFGAFPLDWKQQIVPRITCAGTCSSVISWTPQHAEVGSPGLRIPMNCSKDRLSSFVRRQGCFPAPAGRYTPPAPGFTGSLQLDLEDGAVAKRVPPTEHPELNYYFA